MSTSTVARHTDTFRERTRVTDAHEGSPIAAGQTVEVPVAGRVGRTELIVGVAVLVLLVVLLTRGDDKPGFIIQER